MFVGDIAEGAVGPLDFLPPHPNLMFRFMSGANFQIRTRVRVLFMPTPHVVMMPMVMVTSLARAGSIRKAVRPSSVPTAVRSAAERLDGTRSAPRTKVEGCVVLGHMCAMGRTHAHITAQSPQCNPSKVGFC